MPGLFSTPENDLREAHRELLGAENRIANAQKALPGSHPLRSQLLSARTSLLHARLGLEKELEKVSQP